MARASGTPGPFDFWRTVPIRSQALFVAGVCLIFMPAGLLTDISDMGANTAARLAAKTLSAGLFAVVYVLAVRRPRRWFPPLIAGHVLFLLTFDRIFGVAGAPLVGAALHSRLTLDVSAATTSITIGFALLSAMIRHEGTRAGHQRAEIALARDIHRRLVPRIDRRVGPFEFRGVSAPSGEVGGDLIDVVDRPDGWTAFIADVSGHGVAAGVLMGMLKSAARTELRNERCLDDLACVLNSVLFELKSPAMFATFAGLQLEAPSRLRFIVAGHLPILHYRRETGVVAELTMSQLPLAMFQDARFTSERVEWRPGDLFVILTDGLTEVFDARDQEFGLDRITSLVGAHATAPLDVLEHQILAAVQAHGPQLDDQTILLVRALG